MGKRSSFERNPRDFYPTPIEGVIPLNRHLGYRSTYAEPCCGELDLIKHLSQLGDHICMYEEDIKFGHDALDLTEGHLYGCEYIITNPPWDRDILHPMIEVFRNLRPTWLLIDADWMHTKQAAPYLKFCHKIVSVGRLKWIPDSKNTGKDNCCWYLFDSYQNNTRFYGR